MAAGKKGQIDPRFVGVMEQLVRCSAYEQGVKISKKNTKKIARAKVGGWMKEKKAPPHRRPMVRAREERKLKALGNRLKKS